MIGPVSKGAHSYDLYAYDEWDEEGLHHAQGSVRIDRSGPLYTDLNSSMGSLDFSASNACIFTSASDPAGVGVGLSQSHHRTEPRSAAAAARGRSRGGLRSSGGGGGALVAEVVPLMPQLSGSRAGGPHRARPKKQAPFIGLPILRSLQGGHKASTYSRVTAALR